MIGRKLFVAIALSGSVVISACSDMTAPNTLASRESPMGIVFAPQSGSAFSIAAVSTGGPPPTAEGSRPCTAPGGGYPGALNMLHDETMFTIPMTRNAPQGNVGMFRAVAVSGC
ncbi:MAG TPA: hypothetical protein VFS56_02280 [Gemmatimonadaceae bacterium]|nr:hypothetical protein [Gemmatimonadaceae bacterium]